MSNTLEFFPFPVVFGQSAVELTVTRSDTGATVADRMIDLSNQIDGPEVTLSVSVVVPAETLERVLPQSERADPPVDALLVVGGDASRLRDSVRLKPEAGGREYRGEWSASRAVGFGDIHLEPVLIRSRGGSDPGFADHPGALLARGAPVTVRLDERDGPLGETLDVKFIPFAETPGLEGRADDLYSLDFESNPPRVLLNSSVPHFKQIMKSKAPRGRDARVRNALYPALAAQVWTTLASVAFSDLHGALLDESGSSADPAAAATVLDELPAWEASVIRFLALKMYPGAPGGSVEALATALGGGVPGA
jgi:hypothetical protein